MKAHASKAVTIKDVAARAGVSIATVSRVINQNDSVNPKLAEQVERAIAELNYTPNSLARGLKSSSTYMIAYLVSNISDPFFVKIAEGIENHIRKYNFSLIVCSTNNSKETEAAYINLLREKKVDGLIINTTGYNDELISEVSNQIPTVLSNRRIINARFQGDFIDRDNLTGSADLAKHLLSLGHRRIGIINGPSHLSTAHERYLGFFNTMRAAGVPMGLSSSYCYEGLFTKESGYRGAEMLMLQPSPPTAIVCMSSEISLGAMQYFVRNRIVIPRDVSIACFDSLPNWEVLCVQPTVVFSDLTVLGDKMGELLLERIDSYETIPNREIRFTTQLLMGNSSAPL